MPPTPHKSLTTPTSERETEDRHQPGASRAVLNVGGGSAWYHDLTWRLYLGRLPPQPVQRYSYLIYSRLSRSLKMGNTTCTELMESNNLQQRTSSTAASIDAANMEAKDFRQLTSKMQCLISLADLHLLSGSYCR
jgi:hypothetical protein